MKMEDLNKDLVDWVKVFSTTDRIRFEMAKTVLIAAGILFSVRRTAVDPYAMVDPLGTSGLGIGEMEIRVRRQEREDAIETLEAEGLSGIVREEPEDENE